MKKVMGFVNISGGVYHDVTETVMTLEYDKHCSSSIGWRRGGGEVEQHCRMTEALVYTTTWTCRFFFTVHLRCFSIYIGVMLSYLCICIWGHNTSNNPRLRWCVDTDFGGPSDTASLHLGVLWVASSSSLPLPRNVPSCGSWATSSKGILGQGFTTSSKPCSFGTIHIILVVVWVVVV